MKFGSRLYGQITCCVRSKSHSTPLDRHHYAKSGWTSYRVSGPASCPFAAGHCQDSAFSRT